MADDSRKKRIRGALMGGGAGTLLLGLMGAAVLVMPGLSRPDVRPESQVHMAGRVRLGNRVTGSAFVVAPGLVVTNAHVTMRCRAEGRPLTVGGLEGWRVAREEPSTELALLAGPVAGAPHPLRLSAVPVLPRGTRVLLLGYPLSASDMPGGLAAVPGTVAGAGLTVHRPAAGRSVSFFTTGAGGQSVEPSWQDGVAYFGTRNADSLRWILSVRAVAGHGDSGGPIVDENGNAVGVIFAGNPDSGQTSGVTLRDLRQFLSDSDIVPVFGPPPDRSPFDAPDWQRALTAAAPSVLRVGC